MALTVFRSTHHRYGQRPFAYDIADACRLQRVHRERCNKHVTLLEYSIFLLVSSVGDQRRCLEKIATLISSPDDDLRCYCLPGRSYQARIGCVCLPTGVRRTGLPMACWTA